MADSLRYHKYKSLSVLAVPVFLALFSSWSFVEWVAAQTNGDIVVSNNERPIGDIRKDVAAFIKRSKSKEPDEKAAAVFDLCLLHREIVNDPRFERDGNLVSFRATIGSRLKKCKREIEIAQKRAARARKQMGYADRPNDNDERLIDDAREDMSDEVLLATAMSNHLHTIGQVTGGPAKILDYANGNFGGGHENELISLIESTIAPDTWRINGGDGQIFYYRPVLALVVTASGTVQGRVEDLLRTLRRNQ